MATADKEKISTSPVLQAEETKFVPSAEEKPNASQLPLNPNAKAFVFKQPRKQLPDYAHIAPTCEQKEGKTDQEPSATALKVSAKPFVPQSVRNEEGNHYCIYPQTNMPVPGYVAQPACGYY